MLNTNSRRAGASFTTRGVPIVRGLTLRGRGLAPWPGARARASCQLRPSPQPRPSFTLLYFILQPEHRLSLPPPTLLHSLEARVVCVVRVCAQAGRHGTEGQRGCCQSAFFVSPNHINERVSSTTQHATVRSYSYLHVGITEAFLPPHGNNRSIFTSTWELQKHFYLHVGITEAFPPPRG
eukprot:1183733-Prorocentrum_minimum.AAC.1